MIGEGNEASQIQDRCASHVRPDWMKNRHTSRTHYVAYSSDGNLVTLCGHQHDSVTEAVKCIHSADGSVKAFTDGQERPLTNKEKDGMVRALLDLYGHAKKVAREDPLTRVLNRRGFVEVLERESTRSRRSTLPLTILFCDLNNFRSVNDTLGHNIGDLVLKVLGWTIQRTLCEADSVARLGGDMFALLLPETDADNTRVLVGKLREALKDVLRTYRWDITFSMVAVTCQSARATLDEMIEIAERHMRSTKSEGKDCISYLTVD
jgi:diguanylate cyclase (GGDEF)-like protein